MRGVLPLTMGMCQTNGWSGSPIAVTTASNSPRLRPLRACMSRQRFRITVAPRRDDRAERRARNADRVDHDVIDVQSSSPSRFISDHVRPTRASVPVACANANHAFVPQAIRVDLARGRVNHPVVLAQDVDPAARSTDAAQLGQHFCGSGTDCVMCRHTTRSNCPGNELQFERRPARTARAAPAPRIAAAHRRLSLPGLLSPGSAPVAT